MPDKSDRQQGRQPVQRMHRHEKSRDQPGFFVNRELRPTYSASTASTSVSGRSTSSTSAIGALSPFRKPYLRMRR